MGSSLDVETGQITCGDGCELDGALGLYCIQAGVDFCDLVDCVNAVVCTGSSLSGADACNAVPDAVTPLLAQAGLCVDGDVDTDVDVDIDVDVGGDGDVDVDVDAGIGGNDDNSAVAVSTSLLALGLVVGQL